MCACAHVCMCVSVCVCVCGGQNLLGCVNKRVIQLGRGGSSSRLSSLEPRCFDHAIRSGCNLIVLERKTKKRRRGQKRC